MLRNLTCLLLAVASLHPGTASAQVPAPSEGPRPPEPPAPSAAVATPAPLPWRVSLATGAGTIVEVADAFASDFAGGLAGVEERRTSRTEVIVRVDRDHRNLLLGGSYAYTTWDQALSYGGVRTGSSSDQVHTLLAHAFVDWIRDEHVELYSGLAVGVAYWHASQEFSGDRQTDDAFFVAFQIHALGLAVGTPRFRAFAELGLGHEGFLVAGLSGRI